MELLSAPGSYMLSTTQHMPLAIRLSPLSRYLRPSSYLRHALLLGFSSSPHTLSNVCLLLNLSSSPFVPVNLCFFGHPALSVLLPVAHCFFVSICLLISLGRQRGSSLLIITIFLAVSFLPHKSFWNFCHSLSVVLPFSLSCTANPKYIKNHSALPEPREAPIKKKIKKKKFGRVALESFPNKFNPVLRKMCDPTKQGS